MLPELGEGGGRVKVIRAMPERKRVSFSLMSPLIGQRMETGGYSRVS